MSETRDAISEALALNRRLAATLLVRKQELEAAGDPSLAAELAGVEHDYRAALAEIDALRRLGADAGAIDARAVVAGVMERDPVLQTNEERALDAARAHIAELGAEAELGATPGDEPAEAAEAAPLAERADAQARSEFEALRARRQGPPKKTL